MSAVKNLSIDEMTSDRDPDPERVKLILDVIEQGGKIPPVLVNINRFILDGLNRVEAYRQLGEIVIPGVVANTLPEATDVLSANHLDLGYVPPVRRTWDLYVDLKKLSHEYMLRVRNGHEDGLPRGGKLISEALGIRESRLGCITAYYANLFGPPGERKNRALEIQERVESGERTPAWAISYLGKGHAKFSGTVTDNKHQRDTLTQVVASLSGALRALGTLGPINKGLSKDELQGFIKSLGESRRSLAQFIGLLEECRKNG